MNPRQEVDEKDAAMVNDAWRRMLNVKQKQLLMWYFVRRSNPDFICRRLSIKLFPRSVFDLELKRAEDAIEKMLTATAYALKS